MASHTVANEEIITPRSLTARPWYHISGAMLNFKSLFKDCVVEQGYTLNDLTLHWIFKYLLRRYRIYTPITNALYQKTHIIYTDTYNTPSREVFGCQRSSYTTYGYTYAQVAICADRCFVSVPYNWRSKVHKGGVEDQGLHFDLGNLCICN